MDLKALLTKLDTIDNKQVLLESTSAVDKILTEELQLLKEAYVELMERLHYKEIMATRSIKDTEERKQELANLARQNDYPGLFDPVTGKWVDNNGQWAWFGAYQREVERMETHGLIPPAARTSALLGFMGKDEASAKTASGYVSNTDDMIDQSMEIIDKALVSKRAVTQADATPIQENNLRGTLAQSLVESFGYEFQKIAEAISRDEHKKLKVYIEKLKSFKGDPDVEKDVHALIDKYEEYRKYRDVLISQIRDAIGKLKGIRAQTMTEGREQLREEIYIISNSQTNKTAGIFLYYDSNDNLVQYSINEDIGQDLSDVGRGFAAGFTLGYADNAVAYMLSKYKGTTYGEELVRQLKKTEDAKKNSPVLYTIGQLAGAVAIPLGPGGVAAQLAKGVIVTGAEMGLDKYHRTPHNADVEAKEIQRKQKAIRAVQDAIKLKDPKANVGADGALTPELVNLAKKHGVALPAGIKPTPAKVSSTPVAASATSDASAVAPSIAKSAAIASAPSAVAVAAPNSPAAAALAAQPVKAATPAVATSAGDDTGNILMQKLGAKTPQEALAKIKAQTGNDINKVGDLIANLLGVTPAAVSESILYSSMTDVERMTYLRNRMISLNEGKGNATLEFLAMGLEKLGIRGAERTAILSLEKTFGKDATEIVLKSGERWIPSTGSDGKLWIRIANGNTAEVGGKQFTHVNGEWFHQPPGNTTTAMTKATPEEVTQIKSVLQNKGLKMDVESLEREVQKDLATGWKPNVKAEPAPAPAAKAAERPAAANDAHGGAANDAHGGAANDPKYIVGIKEKLAARFPRISAALGKAGGLLTKYGKSALWWGGLAALAAWGFLGNTTDDDGVTTDPSNKGGKGGKGDGDQKIEVDPKEQERKRAEAQVRSVLDALLKQLVAMYPDDLETRQLEDEVRELIGSAPVGDSAQKVDTSKYRDDGSSSPYANSRPGPIRNNL
jgi:hypothetical protein